MSLPDFLIIGSPKAGSTALHAALASHPELFLCDPKEPKFFLSDQAPPPRSSQRGPGDAHSAREWVWSRDAYEKLFAPAPPGTRRGESTPFYLWDRAAHQRIKALVPQVKMVAIIRDPVDRAYSNWTHLWCDGLEPESSFLKACHAEPDRIAAGYAPFWRYLETGLYGQQLEHLYGLFPPEQVFVLRYRALIDRPAEILDEVCAFLGVSTGVLTEIPPSNVSNWVADTTVNSALRQAVRFGAAAGSYLPPRWWRQAQRPLLALLHRGGTRRPALSPDDRAALLPYFESDIALLGQITGDDYTDWLSPTGRGAYRDRKPN